MDSMMKKWKKLMNNEKSNNANEEAEITKPKDKSREKSSRSRPRQNSFSNEKNNYEYSENENAENSQNRKNKFLNSQSSYKSEQLRINKFKNSNSNSNYLNNSHLLNNNYTKDKSFSLSFNQNIDEKNVNNNNTHNNYFSRSNNNANMSKSKEKDTSSSSKQKVISGAKSTVSPLKNTNNIGKNSSNMNNELLENLNADKILKMLYKLLNALPKSNLDNFDIKNFSDDLNDVINLYIKKENSLKEDKINIEQREIILQTKCNTAERMIKEYEIKYLSAEKEKNKLRKLFDEINIEMTEVKERNEILSKNKDMINLLEKNNFVLQKSNENLNHEINQLKAKQELLIQKFNEEIKLINDKYELYRKNLNRLCSYFNEENNFALLGKFDNMKDDSNKTNGKEQKIKNTTEKLQEAPITDKDATKGSHLKSINKDVNTVSTLQKLTKSNNPNNDSSKFNSSLNIPVFNGIVNKVSESGKNDNITANANVSNHNDLPPITNSINGNISTNNDTLSKFLKTNTSNGNINHLKTLSQKTYENLFKLNKELNVYVNYNTHSSLGYLKTSTSRPSYFKINKTNSPGRNAHSTYHYTINTSNNFSQYNNTNTEYTSNNVTFFTNNKNHKNSNSLSHFRNSINTSKGYNNPQKNFKYIKKRKLLQTSEDEFELISIDQYNTLVSETMANYRTESLPIDPQSSNSNIALNKTGMEKTLNNLNVTYGENSLIKIEVKDRDYKNPQDCINILNTNRKIYDDISTSLINIQKMYYDKTIFGIEKFHEFKKKMCKVRVCNMLPKTQDFLSIFRAKDLQQESALNTLINNATINVNSNLKSEDNTNNNNNLNLNSNRGENKEINKEERSLESREKQRIIDKQKEKERQREREYEKRKNKKKRDEVRLKNKIIRSDEMELYAFYKYSSKNFPEGREQFAFDSNLMDLVMFGGIVTNKNNNVWTLDPITLEWEKKNSDNIPPYPRYGHTGVIYQKRLYVFGGKCKSNNYHYLADLEIFDLTESQWFTPNFNSKTVLELRRNHVAALVGNQMIVHGGFNEENKVLNDAHILSMSPLKWTPLNISEFTPGPYLSGHASAVVLPMDIRYSARTSIYKFPENGFGKLAANRIREKGWYLFGGIKDDDGTLSNDIWILRLGRKPLEWIKPIVRGKPPIPRYSHTLNYYEEGNFLICHGGRNDLTSASFALNDTHIFDLSKMEWQQIKLFSDGDNFNVYNRCGHSAILFSMNNLNYLGSSLFILNLDLNYKFKKELDLVETSFDSSKHNGSSTNRSKKKNNNRNNNELNNEFDSGFRIKLPPIK